MDVLLELLNLNEQINYSYILACFGIYVVLVIVLTSAWVRKDYLQRDGNTTTAIFWALFVLIFNIPALMIYLVFRPEERHYHPATGGMNVPLINFMDKENREVLLGIQLKINPSRLTEEVRDMIVDIDWDSNDTGKVLDKSSLNAEIAETKQKINRLQKAFFVAKRQLKKTMQSKPKASELKKIEVSEDTIKVENIEIAEDMGNYSNENNYSNDRKKNKKFKKKSKRNK